MRPFPPLTQQNGLYSLYTPDRIDGTSLWVYFLIADNIPLPPTPDVDYFWEKTNGWFLFIPEAIPIDKEAEFVKRAQKELPTLASHGMPAHNVVWLADPENLTGIRTIGLQTTGRYHTTFNDQTNLDWSSFQLRLCSGINVRLVWLNAFPTLQFSTRSPDDFGRVALYWHKEKQVPVLYSEGWQITLSLAGQTAGSLHFCAGLDPCLLSQHFGCNIQYVTDDGRVRTFSFPFYKPGARPTRSAVTFNIWLNPLLPTLAQATRFEIDNDKPGWQECVAEGFFNNDGSTLSLRPIFPGAGFAFSVRPTASAEHELYLSPIGLYRIESASTVINMMPGLFSREYFRAGSQNTIGFVNHYPACSRTDASQTLDDDFTTSWAYWPDQHERIEYFSQSSASGFYGGDNDVFTQQLDISLGDVRKSPAFPWVPYGGLSNDPLQPDFLRNIQHLETHVLGPTRYALLSHHSCGPLFLPLNTDVFGTEQRHALTPQGMQVEIADDGSWYGLTLAQEEGKAEIRFLPAASAPWFPKDLALALTQNQLFMVATRPGDDWSFIATAKLSGFQCDMTLDADPSRPLTQKTIMVFKLNTTASLAEMVATPSNWTQAALYNDNAEAVSRQLVNYIEQAKRAEKTADNPFANFNRLVEDKSWIGILFFNARLDGNAMPADLQMLLGGVEGDLRIHHLGIQQNMTISASHDTELKREKSALFGVIFHDRTTVSRTPTDLQAEVDYALEKLIVTFSNSAIVQFSAQVGLTINSLFGRAVNRSSNGKATTNTFSLNGIYQSDDKGSGHITFSANGDVVYDVILPGENFSRVVNSVAFSQATLTPISSNSNEKNSGTEVKAKFLLSGELLFNAAPFPDCGNLDLFSWGNGNSGGLPISNLAVNVDFTLKPDGTMEPESRKVALDFSLLDAAPENAAIRTNSLLYSIPLKFSRFLCATDAKMLNASILGATSVNVLQLMPDASTATMSYAASTARYALEFDMPLGSLGALGTSVKLNAKVILGWGPSTTAPDNDAAVLFIQLPQLSAGAGGFELEGILKTTFGDASLLKVDLEEQQTVYGFLFNNIQLSAFGYRFPPGVLVDFVVFAGSATPGDHKPGYDNNLAWFLSVQPNKEKTDYANALSVQDE